MSLQTTLARGEVRHWENQWATHKKDCPPCAHRERCHQGGMIWGELAIVRGRLRAEILADKASIPGQEALFDV